MVMVQELISGSDDLDIFIHVYYMYITCILRVYCI